MEASNSVRIDVLLCTSQIEDLSQQSAVRAVNQFKTPEAGSAGSDIPSAAQAAIAEESDGDEEEVCIVYFSTLYFFRQTVVPRRTNLYVSEMWNLVAGNC